MFWSSGSKAFGTMSKKSAQNRLGLFGESTYTTIGDEYGVKQKASGMGLNMVAGVTKKGKVGKGVYFGMKGAGRSGTELSAPRLYEGDGYMTYEMLQNTWNKERNAKRVSDMPFKPVGASRKGEGLGSYYGTIGGKWKNMNTGGNDKLSREDVKEKPANIVTMPSKKGSFGSWGTMIGYKKGFKGTAGEFSYVPDPYDAARLKEKEERAALRNADERPPFRPAAPPKRGGSGYPKITISKYPKHVDEDPPPKQRTKREDSDRPPFAAAVQKSKTYLSKFPKYQEDPEIEKWNAAREERKRLRAKMGDKPAFCSSASSIKSVRQPSVFKMNIRI